MNNWPSYDLQSVGFQPLSLYGLSLGESFVSHAPKLAAMQALGFSAPPASLDEPDHFFVMNKGDESEDGAITVLLKYSAEGTLRTVAMVLCGRAITTPEDALEAATDLRTSVQASLPAPSCELDQTTLWSKASYEHPSDVAYSAFWDGSAGLRVADDKDEYLSQKDAVTGVMLSASISTVVDANGMAISLLLQIET